VVIGSGEGRNWWCVVFPPLCTTAAMDEAEVVEILTEDQLELITMDKPQYMIKFKSIELLEKFKSFLGI
jgi:stage II sporulation protein R